MLYLTHVNLDTGCTSLHMHQWYIDILTLGHPIEPLFDGPPVTHPTSLGYTHMLYLTHVNLDTGCTSLHMHQWYIDILTLGHPIEPLFDGPPVLLFAH